MYVCSESDEGLEDRIDLFIFQLIHTKIQVDIIRPVVNIQMIQPLANIQMFNEYMPGDIGRHCIRIECMHEKLAYM